MLGLDCSHVDGQQDGTGLDYPFTDGIRCVDDILVNSMATW